jgi:hypothetical protein
MDPLRTIEQDHHVAMSTVDNRYDNLTVMSELAQAFRLATSLQPTFGPQTLDLQPHPYL